MGTPFMGEIKIIAWNYAPKGWAFANGQFLPINQNQALFSLFGTQFGGNGQTTFAIPNLQGRTPIHIGNSHNIGEVGGQEVHTVTTSEMPQHIHFLSGSSATADNINPGTNMFGSFNAGYTAANNLVTITPATVGNVGGSQAHENRQPFEVLNFVVALQGAFPSRN